VTEDPSDDIIVAYELLNISYISNICTKCVIYNDNHLENIVVFRLSRGRATNDR
jgi:hypothetical protein